MAGVVVIDERPFCCWVGRLTPSKRRVSQIKKDEKTEGFMCLVLRALWGGSACLFVVWLRESRDGKTGARYVSYRPGTTGASATHTNATATAGTTTTAQQKCMTTRRKSPKRLRDGAKEQLGGNDRLHNSDAADKKLADGHHATRAGLTNTTAAWGGRRAGQYR